MKKSYYFNLFFVFTLFYAILTRWSIPSCILVICSSLTNLVDLIPKIRRSFRELKKDPN